MPKNQKRGTDRKKRRRARRQLHHTYELEKAGINPADAIQIAAETRAAPEPRDGELFTGPLNYVRQDIARIKKLMAMDVFSDDQFKALQLKMAKLAMDDKTPPSVAVNAYNAISQNGRFVAQQFLKSDSSNQDKDEYHLHLHGDEKSPALQMIEDLEQMMDAGEEFGEEDNTVDGTAERTSEN